MFHQWKEANVKRNGQVAFRIKLKAQNSAKSKASKASSTPTLASVIPEKRKEPLTDSQLEPDSKRRCVSWGGFKNADLRDELRRRELKISGKKSDLIARLEAYEALESEARGNSSNINEFDEFGGDDDDEMAVLDVDNIITTQKSMIFFQLV